MRVKCFIQTVQEVEIPNEFEKLAVPYPWENGVRDEDYEKCTKALEDATGLPVCDDSKGDTFISAVYSVENGEIMMEL